MARNNMNSGSPAHSWKQASNGNDSCVQSNIINKWQVINQHQMILGDICMQCVTVTS